MGNDGKRVDADVVRPQVRGWALRVLIAAVAVLAVAAGVLAWRFALARPAGAKSAANPTASADSQPDHSRPPTTLTTTAPTAASASTTTTTTTSGPIRVLEIGDSLGVDLGEAMQSSWPSTSVQLTMAARGDTGLTNSAYYDWPTVLSGLLASIHPQVVVVLLGANDLQSMVTGSTVIAEGAPGWNAAYAARVTAIVSESVHAGAHVLWIGEPAMQDAFINAGMTQLDAIAQGVVARYPGEAAYLSSNSVLAPNGAFTFDAMGLTGQEVQVRTPDGVHLMPAGADLVAAAAANALLTLWGMHVTGP